MTCILVEDTGVLWLQRQKEGNPAPWESGKNYEIGDLVVPRNPTEAQQEVMFQCVAYIAATPSSTPTWPTAAEPGETFIHGDIEYELQPVDAPPPNLSRNQYFIIDRTITVS